jgi:transposase
MQLHANAGTCPKRRALVARRVLGEGWSLAAAAKAAGVSERSAGKWVRRFSSEGLAGLRDRSSAPRRRPTRTPAERVEAIRKLRLCG